MIMIMAGLQTVPEQLLRAARVAVSPGLGFGEYGEGFVRFALVEDERRIETAVERIGDALRRL